MKFDIEKLRSESERVVAEMEGIVSSATEKKGLTEDESKRFADLEGEFRSLKGLVEKAEGLEEMSRSLGEYRSAPAYGSGAPKEERAKGEGEKATVSGGSTPNPWGEEAPLGEFLRAVASSTLSGRADRRLVETRAPQGQNESVPQEGGYLVGKDQVGGIIQRTFDEGQIARRVRRMPIGANSNGLSGLRLRDASRANGSRFGGVVAYWIGEADRIEKFKIKLDPFEMKLKKLATMCYITEELLQDSVALEALIRQQVPREFAFMLDEAILRGTGTGQPLGIFNSKALLSIPKKAGQASDTVVRENIIAMFGAYQPANGQGAWYINRNVLPQFMELVGVDSAPLWMPANGLAGQQNSTLMGLPVIDLEHAETLGDKGDIMLFDFSEYLVIEKGGLRTDSSMHVRFEYDEMAFRWVWRVDGQPIPDAPSVPYKGAAGEKRSPFVTLDARA